ncbi:MAG: hypothetical protein IJG94_09875 [Clostridia bacterium]|nr:hypothetical protein [Clostridia bacterium]
MKKCIAWVVALLLAMTAFSACAEQGENFFERLKGLEWTFSSGAGGWSTDMRILPDGSFSGEYHDSEMGETGEGYPDGTVYGCSFTGKMSLVEQVNENTWKIRVDELKTDETAEKESIADGIRFVLAPPYGLSEGDEMLLYRPGTPVEGFTEEMLFWAHLMEMEGTPTELPTWFLSSEKNDSGFVAFQAESGMALANPWTDMTAEQMKEVSGLALNVPEGAENVLYRWLAEEKMAEMQFTWENGDYCFRAMPASLKKGELQDISGMYFSWENVEEVTINGCPGTIGQANTGSEDKVERCLWYDEAKGIMYSLSVIDTDLDGLDLTAIAEQITAAKTN